MALDTPILHLLAVCLTLFLSFSRYGLIRAGSLIEEDDEEKDLQRQLRVLNKIPISSFKTKYGIIDCIDIYKQPAFDNPLLKNHKIQRAPSHFPSSKKKNSPGPRWLSDSGISCPDGTVPIRRTTREDLIRQRSSPVQPQDNDPFTSKDPNTYYAIQKLQKLDRPYTSAKAYFSAHMPKVNTGEFSGALTWLYGGEGQNINYISAGWMAHADLYGDPFIRLTGFWKGDGNSGCANTKCPGFVQTYTDSPIGYVIRNISSYGVIVWDIVLSIFQDTKTKNWWLATGADLVPIGYWPKELFPQLGNGASEIAFGGVVKAAPDRITPPMGSGLADCEWLHTAHVYKIHYRTDSSEWKAPEWSQMEGYINCPDVYTVQRNCWKMNSENFGFMYGGTGGICKK